MRWTLAQARQAWLERQHLLPSPQRTRPASAAGIVGEIGWIPMTSGATPYFALLARGIVATRTELARSLGERGELAVVPGPRGSTWLVPTADAPVARAFALADFASREARIAALQALPTGDLDHAHEALRTALAVPRSPDGLARVLSARALRSLGAAGVKNGLATVAALVLRRMWVLGEVSRGSGDGRLDRPVATWSIDPHPRTIPAAADAVDSIAARWLRAHGPLELKAFAAAMGIAAGRAASAFRPLRPKSIEIEGLDGAFLIEPDAEPAAVPAALGVHLLPMRDPWLDVAMVGRVGAANLRAARMRDGSPAPSVVIDGEVAANWWYDEPTRRVRIRAFDDTSAAALNDRCKDAIARLEMFIATQLSDTPSHGSPARIRQRPGETPRPLDIEW